MASGLLEHLGKLFDVASLGIIGFDQDGRIAVANSALEAMFGYGPGALIGQPLELLVMEDTRTIHAAHRDDYMAAPRIRPMGLGMDVQGRRKDGQAFPIEASLSYVQLDGQVIPVAFVADVTVRKRAEAALARYQILSEHASDIFLFVRPDGSIVDANRAAVAAYGFDRETLLTKTIASLHDPATTAGVADKMRLALTDGILYETTHHRSDGTIFPVEINSRSALIDGERLVICVVRDISERKYADRALRQKTVFVHLLQEVAVAANLAVSLEQALQTTIDQICAHIGWPVGHVYLAREDAPHALTSTRIWHLADPERFATFRKVTEALIFAPLDDLPGQVLISGKPEWNADLTAAPYAPRARLISDIGVRAGFAFPVLIGARVAAVLEFFSDEAVAPDAALLDVMAHVGAQLGRVVERARAEEALAAERALLARRIEERTADLSAANAELARVARLKDEFLASMSHELRTPLNAVLGLSEGLQEDVYGPLNSQQLKTLQTIEESGRHLLDLINDILDLAKIGAGKLELELESAPIASLCQASLRLVKQVAYEKHITVETRLDPSITIVRADVRRLKQILVNLLSNAVKFTPAGGRVGLEVAGDVDQQVVHLTVWDTGIGIAQNDLGRLFQPFVQLDSRLARQYGGSGLGLALVYRMVEMHGGSVTMTSEVGTGSRFTVSLPMHSQDETREAERPAPTAQLVANGLPAIRRALIVEDSPTAADQVARYLAELGIATIQHARGAGAVEQALETHPDIIILDILLPDVSGWNVLAQLKADPRIAPIPVLVVSVVDDRSYGFELGAADYLVKPLTRQDVQSALQRIALPEQGEARRTALVNDQLQAAAPPVILLAEDNETSITSISDYLGAKGYQVVIARNGMEATARAREIQPALILMDIQMPGVDGLEATRRIRADNSLSRVPIIALTALAMPGDRERCIAAGADDYLSKPVSLRGLAAAIETHLRPESFE